MDFYFDDYSSSNKEESL